MEEIQIREIKNSETYLIKEFLYEAIFQEDKTNLLPKEIVQEPNISIYYKNFGSKDDNCLVGVHNNKIIGMVWTRIFKGDIKGYGYVDYETPEFSIAVLEEYRQKGIGKMLMEAMLNLLKTKGYKRASLSVNKKNYAQKLYLQVGFKIIKETDTDFVMVHTLEDY